MAKIRRFMDGGQVPPNQYPFANNPNSIQVGGQQAPLDTSLDFTQQYAKGGKVKKYADGGIYTADMPGMKGKAPQNPEVAKPDRKKPDPDAGVFTAEKLKGKNPEAPRDKMPEDFKKKKMKCGGMTRNFADGGMTEGENVNIDEDTRMRARAAIMRRLAGEEDEAPAPVRATPRTAAKRAAVDKEEEKPSASGRARENVAPSGRGAAAGSFRKDTPSPARYPTAAERGSQIRKSMADVEEENVRKRNERASSGSSSMDDLMSSFKRRFGTKAMREETGMKCGGKVKGYAKGGMIDGIAQRGKTKCKIC